jgi:hypothetical protein
MEQLDVTVREAAASALAVLASHTEAQVRMQCGFAHRAVPPPKPPPPPA